MDIFDACDPISDDAVLSELKIDEEFSRRFEHNKKREELHKYESMKKRGIISSSGESSDDDDDEDLAGAGEEDAQFFKALDMVKKQDPSLLQNGAKLFPDVEEKSVREPKAAKKERPLYPKDVLAKQLIEFGPEFQEETPKRNPKVYDEEQEEGIRAFFEAEKEAFPADDGNLFIERKSASEEDCEDDKVREMAEQYFAEEDKELDENEVFLKNYLVKKMWIDREEEGKKHAMDDDIDASEDEAELEKQDKYEAEYNFRHEEAEGDRVLGYSRFIEGSVRKKTNCRKLQRRSKEERMAQAEFDRKEEVKRLKNLKKREIQEKLEKIRAIAGIADGGDCKLGEDDLEEEFDPEEYDRKMKEVFGGDYYDAQDVEPGFGSDVDGDDSEEKPDFSKEDELLGLPKDWHGSKDGFAAAREKVLKREEGEKEGKRKRKRKVSLKEKMELDKELEEYYKLDYEDTIGDIRTRFKYKPVQPNKYGLRADEIIMADDKDLNQYVSMKKIAPYRPDEWKVTRHQRLRKDLILQGGKVEAKKIAKKHDQANGEVGGLSARMKRRRRQHELKLSRSRLAAYGMIPNKRMKRH